MKIIYKFYKRIVATEPIINLLKVVTTLNCLYKDFGISFKKSFKNGTNISSTAQELTDSIYLMRFEVLTAVVVKIYFLACRLKSTDV
jgi:hypothetical protein